MRRFTKPTAATSHKAPHKVSVASWVSTPWGQEKRHEVLPTTYASQAAAWAAIRAMPAGSYAEANPVPAR